MKCIYLAGASLSATILVICVVTGDWWGTLLSAFAAMGCALAAIGHGHDQRRDERTT